MFGLKKPEMKKQIELDRRLQRVNGDESHIYMSIWRIGDGEYYLKLHDKGDELLDSKGQLKRFGSINAAMKAASEIGANQVRINLY